MSTSCRSPPEDRDEEVMRRILGLEREPDHLLLCGLFGGRTVATYSSSQGLKQRAPQRSRSSVFRVTTVRS